MKYRVVFAPEAEEQLAALYRYIASASHADIADRFTEDIVQFCESLSTFPRRGNKRDDVRPGLGVTHYRKRVVIGDGHVSRLSPGRSRHAAEGAYRRGSIPSSAWRCGDE